MRTFVLVAAATTALAAAPASAQHAQHAQHAPQDAAVASANAAPVATKGTKARAAARTLSIAAHDYAFELPDTIEAGAVVLKLDNHGKELHHAWVARLDEGKTLADVIAGMKAHGPPPAWFVSIGGPNVAGPGGSAEATVVLAPGTYVALCFIPAADGVPHVAKGMMKQFTVVASGAGASAKLPAAQNTMTLTDYDFTVATPLTAGRQVVRLRNTASQSHEAVMFQLAPGRTAADVVAWVEKPAGPPPFLSALGLTGIDRGIEANLTMDLARGRYALICFIPDAKDGKPHFAHGMIREITVK